MLTDASCKAAPQKPFERRSDGAGLSLVVTTSAEGEIARRWRFRYRKPLTKKPGDITFGLYPEVTLQAARDKRDNARQLIRNGIDPVAHKCEQETTAVKLASNLLGEVSLKYLNERITSGQWKGKTARTETTKHNAVAAGPLAKTPMGQIEFPALKEWIREGIAVNAGQPGTAKRLAKYLSFVFNYAIAHGYCKNNPVSALLDRSVGNLPKHKAQAYRAITEPAEVGEMMRGIRAHTYRPESAKAAELLALTFVRPANVDEAEWSEIDLDKATWTIPAPKMKVEGNGAHVVPLSRQAVALLRSIPRTGRYVFGGDKPMAHNCIARLLERIGVADRHTAHGFRSTASTLLKGDSEHVFRCHDALIAERAVELQLGHGNPDKIAKVYDRNMMLKTRVMLMQHWADQLDLMARGKPRLALVA